MRGCGYVIRFGKSVYVRRVDAERVIQEAEHRGVR